MHLLRNGSWLKPWLDVIIPEYECLRAERANRVGGGCGTIQVRGGAISCEENVANGTPQESIISPVLFNIMKASKHSHVWASGLRRE